MNGSRLKIIVCIIGAKYCQISVKDSPEYRRLQRATQEPTLKAVVMYEFLVKLQQHCHCVTRTAPTTPRQHWASADWLVRLRARITETHFVGRRLGMLPAKFLS